MGAADLPGAPSGEIFTWSHSNFKCQPPSSIRFGDMEGGPKIKSGSCWSPHIFWHILHGAIVLAIAYHSLTHCCAWPPEGRSVLHIERSWPAIQAAPTDRPMSSSTCCSQFLRGRSNFSVIIAYQYTKFQLLSSKILEIWRGPKIKSGSCWSPDAPSGQICTWSYSTCKWLAAFQISTF